jgi:hypothetical protein
MNQVGHLLAVSGIHFDLGRCDLPFSGSVDADFLIYLEIECGPSSPKGGAALGQPVVKDVLDLLELIREQNTSALEKEMFLGIRRTLSQKAYRKSSG